MGKKLSKNVFLKLLSRAAIFVMSFTAIFFMIYADGNMLSKVSLYPLELTTYEIFESQDIGIQDTEDVLPVFSSISTNPAEKNIDEDDQEDNDRDALIAPVNVTEEERMVWFRRRLSETEILDSNDLTQKFHSRVLEFLNNGCNIQLYMTWFSPAKNFTRQHLLSIETLLKAHPKGCLMIISRAMDSKRGYRILKPIIDRGFKVLAITPDVSFLLKNTPAESWFESMRGGKRDPGYVPFTENLSHLLRIAVLYKYGGVYLDTDYVILRDFYGLRNAIGVQNVDLKTKKWTKLNNAVLIFDINHPLLHDFMEEFSWNYNGNKWEYNGPHLVSRVVERVGSNPGYNLTLLPPKAFYPVDWMQIQKLLKKPQNEFESRWVESMVNDLTDGETYGVHLWNNNTKDEKIEEGSVLAKLVLDHCIICQDIYA